MPTDFPGWNVRWYVFKQTFIGVLAYEMSHSGMVFVFDKVGPVPEFYSVPN